MGGPCNETGHLYYLAFQRASSASGPPVGSALPWAVGTVWWREREWGSGSSSISRARLAGWDAEGLCISVQLKKKIPDSSDPVDWPTRLLCPWISPGKNTGVGCHALLQGIFPTQELKPGLLH